MVNAHPPEDVLTPDEHIIGQELIQFDNPQRIFPAKSNIKLIHSLMMSNNQGERWATVTLTNQSQGRRTLDHKQLLAVFADGSRHFAAPFVVDFEAKQTLTHIVKFGHHKFPIIRLVTRQ